MGNDSFNFKSAERSEKIDRALANRQPTLTVVLENIHDPHNVSAILRSCDAVGVLTVHLLYYIESFPKVDNGPSRGAHKWLEYERHRSVQECFDKLHGEGYSIIATRLDQTARSLFACDFTKPTAIVLGNEHRGISDEVVRLADELVYIPMMGMAESLNVSVASAVCLFEALRQRAAKGMYSELSTVGMNERSSNTPQLSPEALRSKTLEWQLK